MINRVDAFMDFGGIPNVDELDDFVKFVKKRKDKKPTFSEHNVNNGYKRLYKSYEYARKNISKLAKKVMVAAEERSIKKCRDVIKKIPFVGDFFSFQILFDLLDCKVLGSNTDNQWVHLANGAKGGLRKIFSSQKTSKQEFKYARILRDLCSPSGPKSGFGKIGLKFDPFLQKPLSLKNIEHALCGFDTYYDRVVEKTKKKKGAKIKKLISRKNEIESICGMCSKKSQDGKVCYWCGGGCEINWNQHPDGSLLCDVCHKFEIAWSQDDFDHEEVENA